MKAILDHPACTAVACVRPWMGPAGANERARRSTGRRAALHAVEPALTQHLPVGRRTYDPVTASRTIRASRLGGADGQPCSSCARSCELVTSSTRRSEHRRQGQAECVRYARAAGDHPLLQVTGVTGERPFAAAFSSRATAACVGGGQAVHGPRGCGPRGLEAVRRHHGAEPVHARGRQAG